MKELQEEMLKDAYITNNFSVIMAPVKVGSTWGLITWSCKERRTQVLILGLVKRADEPHWAWVDKLVELFKGIIIYQGIKIISGFSFQESHAEWKSGRRTMIK